MMLDVEGDYLDILYIYIFMDKYINVIYITYHKWTMIFLYLDSLVIIMCVTWCI